MPIAIGLGLYSCSQRQTKEGEMLNSNLTTASQDADLNMDKRGGHLFLIYGNNDHWNDYSFEELQKVNENEEEIKTEIEKIKTFLKEFIEKQPIKDIEWQVTQKEYDIEIDSYLDIVI